MDAPSPDDYDDPGMSDGESVGDDTHIRRGSSPLSPSTGHAGSGKGAGWSKSSAHLQKRRRVTRACDECRRKKIKCDGKQPCTHCTVYSYECTYDQPSNRRRNPAPQYIENLEQRVHRAETLLHILIPNLDLSDPGIDVAVAQGYIPGAPGKGTPTQAQEHHPHQQHHSTQRGIEGGNSDKIESMVRAVAQIEMDESGNWDYHGHSSGLSFMRRMREQLGDLMGPDAPSTPFVKTRPMSQVLDSPKSSAESPLTDTFSLSASDLPPKSVAREACRCAIEDAAALMRIAHGPTFWKAFERLYHVTPEQYTNEDQKFLPLFHSAMGLGLLFSNKEADHTQEGYENAIQQGFVHFKTARTLLDIADCRDLMSIQAVMMMILFLQSSAKLSQCYAYVGVALRSALRMGLHRSYKGNFDPLELETRKRVFWVVRKMDIYVGAMLGLPQTLSDEDIDQEFPTEVDDEYVTKNGILPMPEGRVSLMAAFNAHTRLVQLLSKIVRTVYPIKVQDKELGAADQSYSVPFSAITEIESGLEKWKNDLPDILNPCPAPERYTRVQHLLRLSYAHAQVMLYRPFLHYVARPPPVDPRAYACAASYIGVSRNIIHIQTQMMQVGLLKGAFWFVMYTSFFAILSLVYFAASNPDEPTTAEIMKDAIEGKEVLASLAKRSMAADRCSVTLEGIFQRLPEWMRKGHPNPKMSRKRQHDSGSGRGTPQSQNSVASRSLPDVTTTASRSHDPASTGLHRRSGTFPRHQTAAKQNIPISAPHDGWSPSGTSSMGPQTPTSVDYPTGGYPNYNTMDLANGLNQGAAGLQQYPLQQPPQSAAAAGYPNPAIADLSNMIFPRHDEPFGYPSQPLTTFEHNQQQSAKNHPYLTDAAGGLQYNNGGVAQDGTQPIVAPPSQSGLDDSIEAQFFALPPYLNQAQAFNPMSAAAAAGNHAVGGGVPVTNALPSNGWPTAGLAAQPGGFPGGDINIQDIFGGTEWNSMLMNGFQPG